MYPKSQGVLICANIFLGFLTNGQIFEEEYAGNYKVLCYADRDRFDLYDNAERCSKLYELTPAQLRVAHELAEENLAEWLKKERKVDRAERAEFAAWAATKPEGFGSEQLSFPRPVSEDQVHVAMSEMEDEDETGTPPTTK